MVNDAAMNARFGATRIGAADDDELTIASNAAAGLVRAGKLDEAEQAARDLLVLFPDVHDGYDRLGMVYEARGENRQAAECYRKVIAFIREHPDDYDPNFEDVFVGNAWVRKEQEAVLARVQPEGKEDAKHALFWLWLVVGALVGAAIILLVLISRVSQRVELVGSVAGYLHDLIQDLGDKMWSLFGVLIIYGFMTYGFAILTTDTLLKLRPPPGAALD